MVVHVLTDPADLNVAIADAICAHAVRAVEARGRFFWVLSGGSTPRSLYKLLTTPQWRGRIEWSRVEFFWSDERAVPPDHADSNFRMVREILLDPLSIQSAHIHRMPAERANLDEAAADYELEINTCLGTTPDGAKVPFDLMLLGLGEDAHTASLFPNTRALLARDRLVVANKVPQTGAARLTMTAPCLNRSRAVFFMVSGAAKAQAVAETLGPPDPQRLPAQLLNPAVTEWFLDTFAASRL